MSAVPRSNKHAMIQSNAAVGKPSEALYLNWFIIKAFKEKQNKNKPPGPQMLAVFPNEVSTWKGTCVLSCAWVLTLKELTQLSRQT